MYKYLFLFALLFVYANLKAQTPDTLVQRTKKEGAGIKRDSITSKQFKPIIKAKKEKVYHPDSNHSVRTARVRSMIIPGWGQIYNRHGLWWRLPALYGGLGALIYNLISNGGDYNDFLKESEWRAHGRQGTEPLPIYNGTVITNISDQTIYDFKDQLRRNRDLTIFGIVAVWGVNVIDAYVEAKFIHSYSMDNDLSFKVTPQLNTVPVYASNFNTTFTPGLKITFLFK
jgi:hypothetical protein